MLLAKRIVDDIRRDERGTGDKLAPERVMLEKYQVGRGTLRESLRFLELQGVISLKPGPGGGPTVEKPDSSTLATTLLLLLQFENAKFETIAEARRGFEPLMARLAAERISEDDLRMLESSVDTMRGGLSDIDTFLHTNMEFHEIIAWSSKNAMYGFLIDALVGILDGSALGVDYPVHRRTAVLKAHTSILEALRAHDGDASGEAMTRHIDEYVRYISRKFPEVLARPVTWDLL
ncbi:FadR/GntR family transcriptional regulator [Georgenia sp. AZ-5]|uniref:FadR/GntR family transcriptional regulator n=1 Tax=Georgenia sp. AZ-5 TaxID=3367526 RepID=UPI0037552BB7